MLQILGILNYNLKNLNSKSSLSTAHFFLEASRLAYQDRNYYIADPSYFNVPVNYLLSEKYLKGRSQLIDKSVSTQNYKRENIINLAYEKLTIGKNYEKPSTTHISIIDSLGNAVSLTSSIEFAFGSGITTNGFFLNNQLTDFSFYNFSKKNEKIANSVEPGKKPRSSMAPTLVFQEDELIGVIGSPGGSRIICYVSRVLYEILFLKIDPVKAIASPHLCSRNKFSEIEKKLFSIKLKKSLEKIKHNIKIKEMTSGLNIIWKRDGLWLGIADPRREGYAIGN